MMDGTQWAISLFWINENAGNFNFIKPAIIHFELTFIIY